MNDIVNVVNCNPAPLFNSSERNLNYNNINLFNQVQINNQALGQINRKKKKKIKRKKRININNKNNKSKANNCFCLKKLEQKNRKIILLISLIVLFLIMIGLLLGFLIFKTNDNGDDDENNNLNYSNNSSNNDNKTNTDKDNPGGDTTKETDISDGTGKNIPGKDDSPNFYLGSIECIYIADNPSVPVKLINIGNKKIEFNITLDDKIIDVSEKGEYKFKQAGEFKVKIKFFNSLNSIESLFSNCNKLKKITEFITANNIININNMVTNCSSLEYADLSDIKLSQDPNTSLDEYFNDLNPNSNITPVIKVNDSWEKIIAKATDLRIHFEGVFTSYKGGFIRINTINFSNDTSKYLINYLESEEFYYTINSIEFYINATKVKMTRMHYFYDAGKSYYIIILFGDEITKCKGMFKNFQHYKEIDLSHFNTKKIEDIQYMFFGCEFLDYLNLYNVSFPKAKSMSHTFRGLTLLTSINLKSFNTSSAVYMNFMFAYSGFTSLDLSSFDTSKVKEMNAMFKSMDKLMYVNLSSFNTASVTSMNYLFFGCISLTSLNISNFNTSKVEQMEYMFHNNLKLCSLNLSNFDTKNVKNMASMFSLCDSLTYLDVSNFNTEKVTSMFSMFYGITSLNSLNIKSFYIDTNTDIGIMFSNNAKFKICINESQIDIIRSKIGNNYNYKIDC